MENPNLLWKTIRYSPWILFSIEPTSKRVQESLGKKEYNL